MSENKLPNETEQILKELQEIYDSMMKNYRYEQVDVSDVNIPDISMLCFMICLDPYVNSYGCGIGYFVYGGKDVYQFHYNIHTPHSKGPRRSNQMTSIDQVVLYTRHGITSIKTTETLFFQKAFWDHTPDSYLNSQDKSLRALIKSLQAYCRKENLCAELRKIDKIHEKYTLEQRARFLMENTTYGVTGLVNPCKVQEGTMEGMSREEQKLAMNTGAGVLLEQKGV